MLDQPSSASQGTVDRFQLFRWLLPHCEPDHVALLYPKGDRGLSPGWVQGNEDAERAIEAYQRGTLASERFASNTKSGTDYKIVGAVRLGLVPHRNGVVTVFCVDLDDHLDDGGNVHLLTSISRFFAAQPVVFTSKGGKGLHCFFRLAEPMDTREFVQLVRAWGFNRKGQIELFPKTEKLTQIWLPKEPNDHGGDTYVSGDLESCVVRALPPAPTESLTTTTLNFVRGFVRQPGRNDALNNAALEMGKKQLPRHEAWRLCHLGARLCGLAEEEPQQTRTTFESGYEAGLGSTKVELRVHDTPDQQWISSLTSDVGNAARLVRRYGEQIRYCHSIGMWLAWDSKRWLPDQRGRIVQLCKATALAIYDEAKAASGETQKQLSTWALASQRRERLTAMAALAQPEVAVATEELDADPWAANCLSGTIDLRTGELRPHRKQDLITKLMPVEYDPKATCPRFCRFLDEVFEGDAELIRHVQRWLGHCLTADISQQLLPIFIGEGNNGKNVLLDTVCAIMGDYAGEAPPDLLTIRKHPEHPTEIADLLGKRLVIASETERDAELRVQLVKRLTGNAKLKARRMRQDYFEFARTHKMILVTNNRPVIKEDTEAVWRRLRIVPFNVVIPPEQRDPNLLRKLESEHEGILAWLVRGCVDWQREGLTEPAAVSIATQDYRGRPNSLHAFLHECCTLADGLCTLTADLIEAHEGWCNENGMTPLRGKTFAAAMERTGCFRRKISGQRHWVGVGLDERAPGHNGHKRHELPVKRYVKGKSPVIGQLVSMVSMMSSGDEEDAVEPSDDDTVTGGDTSA